MKRGVFINLRILFFLVLLVALPFLLIFGLGPVSEALGCEMSGASMPGGVCGLLYTILVVVGWTSIGIVPLTVGALLLYLVGVLVFFVGNLFVSTLRVLHCTTAVQKTLHH